MTKPQRCCGCGIRGRDFKRMWQPFTFNGTRFSEQARGQNSLCPDCYIAWYAKNGETPVTTNDNCKICDVVKTHRRDLADDPERLTSDFILGLIGTFHQQRYRRSKSIYK